MSEPVFDEWVFGYTSGSTRHATMRQSGSLPGSFFITGLCPARDAQGGRRATNDLFDPDSPLITDRSPVCPTCERRWRARYGPQDPRTKTCSSCTVEQSLSQFPRDGRTRDGHNRDCLTCIEERAAESRADAKAIEDADHLRDALDEAADLQARRIDALATFQAEPSLPTYLCASGHTLTPAPATTPPSGFGRWGNVPWPSVGWMCPCGTVEFSGDWTTVVKAVEAVATIATLPAPDPVKVP